MVIERVACSSARDASRRGCSELDAQGKEIKDSDQHGNLGNKS